MLTTLRHQGGGDRLHLLAIHTILLYTLTYYIKAEEIAYKNDGIVWEPIPYSDNGHIIAIIEGRTKGVFDMLDRCV